MTAERQLLTENLNFVFLTENERTRLAYNAKTDKIELWNNFGELLDTTTPERLTKEELQEEFFKFQIDLNAGL